MSFSQAGTPASASSSSMSHRFVWLGLIEPYSNQPVGVRHRHEHRCVRDLCGFRRPRRAIVFIGERRQARPTLPP